jgi:hypothetical protein
MARTNPSDMGTNRTGIAMSPIDSASQIEVARITPPSSPGNDEAMALMRAPYIIQADPVGTMPPPATVTGVVGALSKMLKGEKLALLLDKLGERLAFERTGTRLYDSLIQKWRELPKDRVGPGVKELQMIRDEEYRHFDLVSQTMVALGADPTAQTPCADVAAVVSDPRTTKGQSLHAILIAELADNAGWELLIQIAAEMGHDQLARSLKPALGNEMEHAALVKSWLAAYTRVEGGLRRGAIPAKRFSDARLVAISAEASKKPARSKPAMARPKVVARPKKAAIRSRVSAAKRARTAGRRR